MSIKSKEELLKQLKEHMTRTNDVFKFKGVTDEFNKLGNEIKKRYLKNPDDPLIGINDKILVATGNTQADKLWYKDMTRKIIQFVNTVQSL